MTAGKVGMIIGNRGAAIAHRSTIAAGYARALVEFAVGLGAERATLMRAAGAQPDDFLDPEGRIGFARYVALMRVAKAQTRDAALALHFGEAYATEEISIVGLIGQSARNAADAMAHLDRYTRLIADVELDDGAAGRRFGFEQAANGMLLIDRRKDPNDFPEMTESSAARMMRSSRRLADGKTFIKAVYFTHREPPYRAEYDRIFQVPLFFESRHNALLFAGDAWQDLRPANTSAYLLGILKERADGLLRKLPAAHESFRHQVDAAITAKLCSGDVAAAAIARHLGMTRQTLHRRLKAEGTSFTRILNDLRERTALSCLARAMSVSDTALYLGFSDAAAFSRAFKRWTGASPSALRSATP